MNNRLMIILFLVLVPAAVLSQSPVAISLTKATLPDTIRTIGYTTLAFSRAPEGTLPCPSSWNDIETAPLFEIGVDPGKTYFVPAHLVRFKDSDGTIKYAVDNGSGRLLDSQSILNFHEINGRAYADLDIGLIPRTGGGRPPWTISCQIRLADQNVAARIAEYRRGIMKLGNKDFSVHLLPSAGNNPYYSLIGGAACLIDMDGDSTYAPIWKLSETGAIVAAERISLTDPFILDHRKLIAGSIDPSGNKLVFEDFPGDTAITVGFHPPNLTFTGIYGGSFDLASLKGKVVLLTFWSSSCPYSEKVRPLLNSLISRSDTTKFRSVAISRDPDINQIKAFTQSNIYMGTVTTFDDGDWKKLNRRYTTPVFYLIDRDGIIRLTGSGTNLFAVVDKMITEMMK